MDGFAWRVIGSLAGVVAAVAAVIAIVPLLAARRREKAAAQPGTALADAGITQIGFVPPGSPAVGCPAFPGRGAAHRPPPGPGGALGIEGRGRRSVHVRRCC